MAVDAENHCFFIVKSDILDNEPLYLGSESMIYKGSEETNLENIYGGTKLTEADRLNFDALEVGDRVKATYSITGGKYVAETLCLIR